MNREDIIRMAREAGFVIDEAAQQHQPNCIFHTWHMIDEGLTRFASLVAAAEREAVIVIVNDNSDSDGVCCTDDLLAAIRARSNT